VGRDGNAKLLAHHGGYLFWSIENGDDPRDLGLSPVPTEPGVYYFTGTPWSHWSDTDCGYEFDSGFDIDASAPATDEHFAIFGATRDEFAENIAEHEAEQQDKVVTAAP
jgi:hypothetical protein